MFLVRGLGLRSANLLIKHFKEPERAFDSTRNELEALGVPPEVADALTRAGAPQHATKTLAEPVKSLAEPVSSTVKE